MIPATIKYTIVPYSKPYSLVPKMANEIALKTFIESPEIPVEIQ